MMYSTLDNRQIRLLVVASGNDFEADIQCQLVVRELPDIKPSHMPDDKPKDKTDDKPNRKTDERPNEKPDAKPNNKSRLKSRCTKPPCSMFWGDPNHREGQIVVSGTQIHVTAKLEQALRRLRAHGGGKCLTLWVPTARVSELFQAMRTLYNKAGQPGRHPRCRTCPGGGYTRCRPTRRWPLLEHNYLEAQTEFL